MQFRSGSSDILAKHLMWNSSHNVDQSLVKIFEHSFLHWLLDALWQQCHFAESMPTLSIRDTSTDVVITSSPLRKHCQKCSWGSGGPHPPTCRPSTISCSVVLVVSTSLQASRHLLLLDLSQQCMSEAKE